MKHVLITGSSGYVGSHTAKYFSQQGWQVFGLDRRENPKRVAPFLQDFEQAEIGDVESVQCFCQRHDIQAVVHCAALCLVGESVKNPKMYYENNVVQGKAFVRALKKTSVKSFVFSSTAAVYGEPQAVPISESHTKAPVNPYGETKWEFEKALLEQEKTSPFAVGIFRYFNAAGADPDGQLGEVHDPETHIIPNAIMAALDSNPGFAIFGNDFDTRDGTCERDYVHVWDLARAHLMLTERLVGGGQGGVYNLGVGQGYTVKEVVDMVARVSGQVFDCKMEGRRPGDPARLVADPTQAREVLGWCAKHSDLQTIVEQAYRWHSKQQSQNENR